MSQQRLIEQQRLEKMRQETQTLIDTAQRIQNNKAFRIYEALVRCKQALRSKTERKKLLAFLRGGMPDARFQPVAQLTQGLLRLLQQQSEIYNETSCDFFDMHVWDGCYKAAFTEEYYAAFAAWRTVVPEGTQTAQVWALCSTADDAAILAPWIEELKAKGISCKTASADPKVKADVSAAQIAPTKKPQAFLCCNALSAAFFNHFGICNIGCVKSSLAQPLSCEEHARVYADLQRKSKKSVNELVETMHRQRAYGVLMLGTINYDFLTQRPQHLAREFENAGCPVFYVNADFVQGTSPQHRLCEQVHVLSLGAEAVGVPNIYEATLEKTQEALQKELILLAQKIMRECGVERLVILNEYPVWQPAAVALRAQTGCAIVADYLDDYLGFPDADKTKLGVFAAQMLEQSDAVVATSDYLAQKASAAKNLRIIRNGTECTHFDVASRPQQKKVVGYFGVLSDWFACEMIEALNASDLDICIRLIGVSTPNVQARLKKCEKVELCDALPYSELPGYLAAFDVCLIPFDTRTDLIKATNPVKFYEYLSAGKKIVATEIPELMPYRNRYAYLENEPGAFVEKVKLCLEDRDILAPEQKRRAFARENSWQQRAQDFLTCMEMLNSEKQGENYESK